MQRFERVIVDHGAVAWPGNVDLAPDAMYEDIARLNQRPTPTEDRTVAVEDR
jgi:hypothetical protein